MGAILSSSLQIFSGDIIFFIIIIVITEYYYHFITTNILLLFNIYNNNKTAKTVCLLNISILLIIKGIYMYINKLGSEFLNVLIIKIGVCSLLFIEYYIFLN